MIRDFGWGMFTGITSCLLNFLFGELSASTFIGMYLGFVLFVALGWAYNKMARKYDRKEI